MNSALLSNVLDDAIEDVTNDERKWFESGPTFENTEDISLKFATLKCEVADVGIEMSLIDAAYEVAESDVGYAINMEGGVGDFFKSFGKVLLKIGKFIISLITYPFRLIYGLITKKKIGFWIGDNDEGGGGGSDGGVSNGILANNLSMPTDIPTRVRDMNEMLKIQGIYTSKVEGTVKDLQDNLAFIQEFTKNVNTDNLDEDLKKLDERISKYIGGENGKGGAVADIANYANSMDAIKKQAKSADTPSVKVAQALQDAFNALKEVGNTKNDSEKLKAAIENLMKVIDGLEKSFMNIADIGRDVSGKSIGTGALNKADTNAGKNENETESIAKKANNTRVECVKKLRDFLKVTREILMHIATANTTFSKSIAEIVDKTKSLQTVVKSIGEGKGSALNFKGVPAMLGQKVDSMFDLEVWTLQNDNIANFFGGAFVTEKILSEKGIKDLEAKMNEVINNNGKETDAEQKTRINFADVECMPPLIIISQKTLELKDSNNALYRFIIGHEATHTVVERGMSTKNKNEEFEQDLHDDAAETMADKGGMGVAYDTENNQALKYEDLISFYKIACQSIVSGASAVRQQYALTNDAINCNIQKAQQSMTNRWTWLKVAAEKLKQNNDSNPPLFAENDPDATKLKAEIMEFLNNSAKNVFSTPNTDDEKKYYAEIQQKLTDYANKRLPALRKDVEFDKEFKDSFIRTEIYGLFAKAKGKYERAGGNHDVRENLEKEWNELWGNNAANVEKFCAEVKSLQDRYKSEGYPSGKGSSQQSQGDQKKKGKK